MKMKRYKPISIEDFTKIKRGDRLHCEYNGLVFTQKANSDAYYNYDCVPFPEKWTKKVKKITNE